MATWGVSKTWSPEKLLKIIGKTSLEMILMVYSKRRKKFFQENILEISKNTLWYLFSLSSQLSVIKLHSGWIQHKTIHVGKLQYLPSRDSMSESSYGSQVPVAAFKFWVRSWGWVRWSILLLHSPDSYDGDTIRVLCPEGTGDMIIHIPAHKVGVECWEASQKDLRLLPCLLL